MGKSISKLGLRLFGVFLFFCPLSLSAQENTQGMSPEMFQRMMQTLMNIQQNAEMKCGSTLSGAGDEDEEDEGSKDYPEIEDGEGNGLELDIPDRVICEIQSLDSVGSKDPECTYISSEGKVTCTTKGGETSCTCPVEDSGIVEKVEEVVEKMKNLHDKTINAGVENCKCCLTPSVCLLGGVGKVLDVLRVGNWAGLLASSKFANLCKHLKKTQIASAGMDGAASAKCFAKARKCSKAHDNLIEKFTEIKRQLQTFTESTFDSSGACTIIGINAPRNIVFDGVAEKDWFEGEDVLEKIEEFIKAIKRRKAKSCGEIKTAGINMAAQAGMTLLGSKISAKCQANEEENKACDKKTGEDLDKCCEENPSADDCEGRNTGHPCHPLNVSKDPQKCQEECRKNPSHPFCKNFCLAYWPEPLCSELVCQHFQMAKCSANMDCNSEGCEACKESGYRSEACNKWCQDNPNHPQCQCPSNPKMCRCSNPDQADYVPGGCGTSDDGDVDCDEDPSHESCRTLDRTDLSSNEDLTTDSDGDADSPFLPPNPFAGNSGAGGGPPASPLKYSPPGSGSAPGAGGGGSSGGGGGPGGDPEAGEGEGGPNPYDDLLAGLTKSKGGGGGLSGFSKPGGRSAANKKGKGFDLRKFLPKKKKKKSKKKSGRKPASPEDSIFDVASEVTSVFCSKNQVDCINQK